MFEDIKILSNSEIEMAFIASILIDNSILYTTNVTSDWFDNRDCKSVYLAMIESKSKWHQLEILPLSIMSNISSDTIFNISTTVMTSSWRQRYEEAMLELYTKRKLLKIADDIKIWIDTVNSNEILMKIKKILESTEDKSVGIDWFTLIWDTINELTTTQDNICRYDYPLLDKYLWGYREWQLIVIWWRPWFWKTAFIIELLQRIIKQEVKASIYSLEMSNRELVKRLLSNWTGLNNRELVKADKQDIIIERAEPMADYMRYAMFYDKIFDFNYIERSIRRGAIVNGHKIIFIDHLWLIRSNVKSYSRAMEIWYMTSSLKTLAKELGVTIVILSQLNRNVEIRNDEPELSDLRDSWSIEQDADVVMMIHRDKDIENNYNHKDLDILIRKNRNGNLARIGMESDLWLMRIKERNVK